MIRQRQRQRQRQTGLALGISLILALSAAACDSSNKLIQKITFSPSSNLESVRVALVFNPKTVQSTLGGGFAVGEYGYLFVNPYTPTLPFEVGFELNTEIFQDPKYAQLEPTTVFPNGIPMNLPHAVVEVRADQPVGKRFDVYAYVDVLHARWLGTAVMLDFLDDKHFPPGLALSQVFMRDAEGKPTAIAAVFGPELDQTGAIVRPGGIAVLTDVKSLLGRMRAGQTLEAFPEGKVQAHGPDAKRVRSDLPRMLQLEQNVIQGLNAN